MTPSLENIIEELSTFIQESILDQSISFDEDLTFKELGIDSVAIIQIVLLIERKYGITMTEKDLTPDNLKSIKTLADFTFKNI